MDIRRNVDHVVRDLCDRVASQHGFLTSIRVTRPPDIDEAELKAVLTERLADAGLDFVDLFLEGAEGDVRLLDVTFEQSREAGGRPRLLLAVDLAEPSDELVDLAREWTERLDGVLSVVFAGMYADVSALFLDRQLHDVMQEELRRLRKSDRKQLEALLERLPERHRGRAYLVDKPVVPGIEDLEPSFDVLLVGTHGRTGLTRLGLGSVAEKLVRTSNRSVIVLRTPPYEVTERPAD